MSVKTWFTYQGGQFDRFFHLGYITDKDIQFNILKAFALRQYRVQLKNLPEIADIQMFERFEAGPLTFTLNQTKHNLTSKIFRYIKTDAVIHINENLKAASITFKINSKQEELQEFKNYLLDKLTEIEPGWVLSGTHQNRLVNPGITENYQSNIQPWTYEEIIKKYYDNKT